MGEKSLVCHRPLKNRRFAWSVMDKLSLAPPLLGFLTIFEDIFE